MADLPNRRHLHRVPVWLPIDSPVVYFVTACCYRRQRIFIADDLVRVAAECLRRCQERHGWDVSQACWMPDHVHLLAMCHYVNGSNLWRSSCGPGRAA